MNIVIQKIAHLTGHIGAIFAISEGRNSQYILSGGGDGWIVEWDLANPDIGKLLAKIDTNIYSLAFSKEKNIIIAGNREGGVHFIDTLDASNTKNIAHHKKGTFAISNQNGFLLTLGGEGMLTKWDNTLFHILEGYHLSAKSLRGIDINDKNELAIGASDGNIYILSANLELLNIIEKAHDNSIFSLKYIPHSSFLVSGSRDAHLKVWNTEGVAPTCVQDINAHWYTINAIVLHPTNPTIFATASRDKTIKIWQSNTEGVVLLKVIDTIKYGCHARSVNALYWSSYNNWLISASDDRTLMVWQVDF